MGYLGRRLDKLNMDASIAKDAAVLAAEPAVRSDASNLANEEYETLINSPYVEFPDGPLGWPVDNRPKRPDPDVSLRRDRTITLPESNYEPAHLEEPMIANADFLREMLMKGMMTHNEVRQVMDSLEMTPDHMSLLYDMQTGKMTWPPNTGGIERYRK